MKIKLNLSKALVFLIILIINAAASPNASAIDTSVKTYPIGGYEWTDVRASENACASYCSKSGFQLGGIVTGSGSKICSGSQCAYISSFTTGEIALVQNDDNCGCNSQFTCTCAKPTMTNTPSANICIDSDNGLSYFTKGYVDTKSSGSTGHYSDLCWNGTNVLHEWVCLGTNPAENAYTCPNGCVDGACIKETKNCIDTDGGLNKFIKGDIIDAARPVTFKASDKCETINSLIEYTCENDAWYANHLDCPDGCLDGACIASPQKDKITITVIERSGQDLKDYQVLVNLNKDNLSFDPDKNKLSFTDENNTKLNYWIEDWNRNAKKAKIWIKIPELKASETKKIYMDLNGNDLSDGENTFVFFDDFSGSLDKTKWDTSGSPAVSGGVLTLSGTGWIKTRQDYSTVNIETVTSMKVNSATYGTNANETHIGIDPSVNWFTTIGFIGKDNGSEHGSYIRDSVNETYGMWTGFSLNSYHRVSARYDSVKTYGSLDGTEYSYAKVASQGTDKKIYIKEDNWMSGSSNADFDWIFVRQYTSREPQIILSDDLTISDKTEPEIIEPEITPKKSPDNNPILNTVKTDDKKTTVSPLTNNIIFFVFFLLVILVGYLLISTARKIDEKNNEMIKTKICLKCGKKTETAQAKCADCGSENFSIKE